MEWLWTGQEEYASAIIRTDGKENGEGGHL